jgi:hypothetical protein
MELTRTELELKGKLKGTPAAASIASLSDTTEVLMVMVLPPTGSLNTIIGCKNYW